MTYEYVCSSCGHEWEASQSIKDAPLKACPKCKRQTAKRQVSGGTGFVLKGSGWYADLYSSAKPAADKDKADKQDKPKDDVKPASEAASKSDSSAAEAKPKSSKKKSPNAA